MPPTSAERQPLLLDTSAAVPFCLEGHDAHEATFGALADHELGLAGHAAFETHSVLTRTPPPHRVTAAAAARLISRNFPHSRFLSERAAAALLAELSGSQFAGRAVYDALVGAAAREHSLILVSRDHRASEIYRLLGVEVQLLD